MKQHRLYFQFTWLRGGLVLLLWLAFNPLLISAATSSEDDYIVDVWDGDRGLPHSSVTSIAQTPDGYLWIGTLHGGLARFDGVRFVTFHPGNTPELPSIEIKKLMVDPAGTLWIGTVEGSVISRRNGRFRFEFENTQTPASWVNNLVASRTNEIIFSSLFGWLYRGEHAGETNRWQTFKPPGTFQGSLPCADRDGIIWYRRGNFQLGRISSTSMTLLDTLPELAEQRITVLTKDVGGRVWVGTTKELAMWDGHSFENMTPTNGEPIVNVQQLVGTPDGGFWVQANNKIQKCRDRQWVTGANLATIQLPFPQRPLQILPEAQGGAWFMRPGTGLWHINPAGGLSPIGIAQGLPTTLINCWFEDREGNLWVGLEGRGLACVRKRVFHTCWPSAEANDQAARSVCEDRNGNLWFGTSGAKVLRWTDGQFTEWSLPATNATSRDAVVYPDAENGIWVGTVQNGIWILETNGLRRPFPSEAVGTVARTFFQDREGRMWIGNEFGLYCCEKGQLKKFTTADGFTSAYILAITGDDDGTIWMGTAVGELRSYRNGKFTSYWPADEIGAHHPAGEREPASTNEIARGTLSGGERFWVIHADHNRTLWIGTLGGGLLRFKDGKFTRYDSQHGLPNDHVSQILEDEKNQLWLGTRGGISRVKREALQRFARGEIPSVPFITYGKSDGLPSIECSDDCQPACWHGADGRLWFTTAKGAIWVNPEEISFNDLPPPVLIEQLRVDNEVVYEPNPGPRPMPATSRRLPLAVDTTDGTLRIPAGRHYFEFKFTALSLASPDKVRFKWRLLGADPDWIIGGADRSVSYSYLAPGEYEFIVQASNNDGVWNEQGAHLKFSVLPYFWQTWWFSIVVGLLVAGLLFLAYSIRIARLRALERLRLRIARDLHDEVGSNLGSISLLAQVMEKNPNAEDAFHVRSIVAQTVDTLRDIVWFIDPSHERLSDLVMRMGETAKTMLATIPYSFRQFGDFRSASLPLDFRRNVMPIFKEALHNVIKHSAATGIKIEVSRIKNVFQFTVQDNGCGFDLSKRQSGNGLKNIRRRAAEMKAQLEIRSDSTHGTFIQLTAKIP